MIDNKQDGLKKPTKNHHGLLGISNLLKIRDLSAQFVDMCPNFSLTSLDI